MSNDTDFQRALETIIKGIVKGAICFEGTIKTVNSDYTCDVDVNKTVFYNVPVSVLKGKRSSFHLQPKVGTNCNLTFRDGNIQRPVITKIHEADKLFIDIEETIFNGGTHGMVKADSALVKVFNALQRRLYKRVDRIIVLSAWLAAWTSVKSVVWAWGLRVQWHDVQLTGTLLCPTTLVEALVDKLGFSHARKAVSSFYTHILPSLENVLPKWTEEDKQRFKVRLDPFRPEGWDVDRRCLP